MKLRSILLFLILILIPTCLANPLPYWIEELPNGSFYIWTKVNISAKGTTYLFIEKKPGYAPDGSKVFLFFYDFSDNNWQDTWEVVRGKPGTEIYIDNGKLVLDGDGPTQGGITVCTKKELDLPNKIRIEAKVYAYDWNEWVGFVISPDLKTNPSNGNGWVDGYDFGWWGWGGTQHCMRTWSGGNSIVDDHSAYPGFYKAQNYTYYFIGGAYNGTTLFHYKPSTTDTISYDHQRKDTKYSGKTWQRIFLMVWNNAKWGYKWIRVRKYAPEDPVAEIIKQDNNIMIVKITNPNNYNLKDFQVKIPGGDIVTSQNDSLYVSVIPEPEINYYKSIGGYTLTIGGDLGNVSLYLDSKLLYTGEITANSPYQKTFIYDISSYPLKIVYYDYGNFSRTYKINSISKGTYTLSLTPVGNYTNESFYPLIITVSGKSYWISNYSCIPLNASITAYKNTPISITTSLGEEISVPAENQKVPIFFTTTYSQVEAKTLQGHIIEFKSKYGIVGYGQDVNIKVPTGLVITPYLDNFPLQPITVSQNLNLFYSPSLIQREIYAYQTIDGKIVVSIKSLLPANFTVLIKGENDTIYLNQSVIPGIYKFNYPDTNQSVILEVLVNNKVALEKNLVPPGEINSWDNLGDLTKIAILFILAAILAIVYLSSGLSAALGLTLAGSLILLLPIPERLKPILAATVFLSIMLYLYLRRW